MMENKLQEITGHFNSGDIHLGTNRLLDLALDTYKPEIYRKTLDWYSWMMLNMDASASVINEKTNPVLLTIIDSLKNTGESHSQNILELDKIGKTYSKGNFSLKPLTFTVKSGEVTGLVGENGNGKTTLLRILARELKEDRGSIEYLIPEVPADNDYLLKSNLVYVPQRIPRWYGTLMDNLQFTLSIHGTFSEENTLRATLMIARMGLMPYKNLTWNQISSGYKTRFELAKSLLRKPKLLLLDEPLANLDIISQQTVLQDLKMMACSVTSPFGMVLSSQQLYEVEKISDQIIFLKDGEAKYQNNNVQTENQEVLHILYEIETKAERNSIVMAFAGSIEPEITFNGGVYILKFPSGTSTQSVLSGLARMDHEVLYIRNISQSSRRFFIKS